MKEIIESIEEVGEVFQVPYTEGTGLSQMLSMFCGGVQMDGYTITTSRQKIYLGISSDQSCCEHFGYFMSDDDLDDFIGAELLDIKITDTAAKTTKFEKHNIWDDDKKKPHIYEGDMMFIDIETSNGKLQFVAYNEHNGYYGHSAVVFSERLKHEQLL